jgi:hypothetical protein
MTNLDVAGLLTTYAMKCRNTTQKEKLQELVRALKKELNSEKIKNLNIVGK